MTDSLDHSNRSRDKKNVAEQNAGLTLHEERLVTSERVSGREIGKVRLRKRVVVEEMTMTVPVRREVIDVVRVAEDGTETVIDAAPDTQERAKAAAAVAPKGAGGRRAESNDEVICYEERPVVTTEIFAVESVRLELSKVARTESETHEVRREEIEFVENPAVETNR